MIRRVWYVFRVLLAARTVQNFLWGPTQDRTDQSWSVWLDVIEKRIFKLRNIDRTGKHWKVEARKRLLQIAAVAIAMIEWIDNGAVGG